MNQQEDDANRRGLAQELAMLSMLYQGSKEVFEAALKDVQADFDASSRLLGGPKWKIRHLAKADGRQRFVIFANGRQYDYFDFSAMMAGGEGSEFEEPDPADPGFWPFDQKEPV